MKKEFGKWFLDLAKYILTAIILTAFFAGLEQTIVLWGTLIFFLISIVVGYILLVQADKENLTLRAAPQPSCNIIQEPTAKVTELNKSSSTDKKSSKKKNKKQ